MLRVIATSDGDGYEEIGRRTQGGFPCVYMRKRL